MDETLVVFFKNGEAIKSVVAPFSDLGVHFYCCHHNLKIVEVLHMTSFSMVIVQDK